MPGNITYTYVVALRERGEVAWEHYIQLRCCPEHYIQLRCCDGRDEGAWKHYIQLRCCPERELRVPGNITYNYVVAMGER